MPRTLEVRHFHERTTVGRSVTAAAAVALLVAASCGADDTAPSPSATPPAVEAIPAAALPGTASDAVALDARTAATGATEHEELETLLLDAGFEGGSERTFSKVAGGRRRLLARVLEFETAAGAQRYVRWLSDHVEELIGDADRDPALEAPGGGTVYVHEPDPCCHNDSRIFLAVWAEGRRAITLEIAGQAARASDVAELTSRLDAAV
jgi:hypothetical protein